MVHCWLATNIQFEWKYIFTYVIGGSTVTKIQTFSHMQSIC